MKKRCFFLLLSIIFVLLATSCRKGGSEAPLSSTGQTGTKPIDTIYSNWYTPSSYSSDTLSAGYQFYTNIPAPGITRDILDKDTVIVYTKTDGYNPVLYPTNLVSQLPFSLTYDDNQISYTDRWSAVVTPGNIRIYFTDDHQFYSGLYYAHKFRYLITSRLH